MGRQRSLSPEFDLPPLLLEVIKGYIGPRNITKLSAEQRRKISTIANTAASQLGEVLEAGNK